MDSRLDRLAAAMRQEGVDAFLAATSITMDYLAGFPEAGGERLLILAVRSTGECRLIAPALSENQARRVGISDVRPWRDGEDPLEHVATLAVDWELRSGVLAVDAEMRSDTLLVLQAALPAALFRSGQPVLGSLMSVKDADEIAAMRRAAAIADGAIPAIEATLRTGRTEREVAAAIELEMRRLGGVPSFAIVATGANSAEPHHGTDDTAIRSGDVVICDFGCSVDGYQSDITRTFAVGDPGDDARHRYSVVYSAQAAGRRAAKPGTACGQVDAACRSVIEAEGLGLLFVHRTGHGIGRRVHEEPYIVAGSCEPLRQGNCFSVEPGVYEAGRFGIRIENIVAVIDAGCVSLNAEPPPELIVLPA